MRLSTQLGLALLLAAVLPLGAVTLYSYGGLQRAYRGIVEAEARRLTEELGQHLDMAGDMLFAHFEGMRQSPSMGTMSTAFQRAREAALKEAQEAELRSLLQSLLSAAGREQGRMPFAIDAQGGLHAADSADVPRLSGLGLSAGSPTTSMVDRNDWVIASRRDPSTGVTIGVAQPQTLALRDLRRTAVWNLVVGLGLVVAALVAIRPLVRGLTRHLQNLTDGVLRLAGGETNVRVVVPRGYELGRLAETFNHMSADLHHQQQQLLKEERLHKELEISRRIQEELVPRQAARFPFAEAAGLSIPAREVGGDFFNYFAISTGEAAVLVGDVSGKGVPAAILMANLQATLSARLPLDSDLSRLADRLDHELGAGGALYLTLFIAVVDGETLRYVNAGHATQLLVRADGDLVRLESTGRPLGLLPGGGYEERSLPVGAGDALVLFTDGVLDAENPAGVAFGEERLEELVRSSAGRSVADLLASVEEAVRTHRGRTEPGDDATLVALRVFPPAVA